MQMNANNSAPGKRGLPALKHCLWTICVHLRASVVESPYLLRKPTANASCRMSSPAHTRPHREDDKWEDEFALSECWHNLTIMIAFRILFGIDALAAAVVAFFFVWGLGDGTVSSFNILLWLVMLGGVGAILAGGVWLRSYGRVWPANGVLLILALPATLFALFFLTLILFQSDWK